MPDRFPFLTFGIAGFAVAILTSQSGMDFFSAWVTLGAFICWFREPRRVLWRTGFEALFAVWFAWIVLGYVVNAVPLEVAAKGLWEFRWMLELIAYVMVWRILQPDEKWLKALMILLVIAGGYSLLVYLARYDLIHETWSDRATNLTSFWRSGGFYNDAMAWSHTAGPFLCLCFGLFLVGWRRRPDPVWKWWLAGTIAMAIATLVAMTRGVWFAAFLTLPMMALLGGFKKKKIFMLMGLIVVATLAVPSVRQRLIFTLKFQTTHDSDRLVLWRANGQMVKDSPLWGWGYGENSRRLREVYDQLGLPASQFQGHAHNQFIHFASGTGLVGLGLFLCFLVLLVRRGWFAWRRFSSRGAPPWWLGLTLGATAALICFALGGFTEANFSIAKNRYAFLFLASLLIWISEKEPA